jgi:hypothetical protein
MESRDPASSWTLLFLSSTEHVWRHSERKHFFRKLQFALLSSAIELPRLVLTQYVCRMENHAPSLQDHNQRAHDHDAHLHHLKGNQRINNSTSFGFTNPWLLRTAKYRAREYVVTGIWKLLQISLCPSTFCLSHSDETQALLAEYSPLRFISHPILSWFKLCGRITP